MDECFGWCDCAVLAVLSRYVPVVVMAKITAKTAKRRAWKACSIYIRTKFSVNGMVQCVTCGSWNSISETDAGHFIPKKKGNAIYFVEENIFPQCQYDNRFDGENSKIRFTTYMIENYGQEKIDELQKLAQTKVRYRTADYLEIEAEYKQLLRDL